jgi:hypothetical protein
MFGLFKASGSNRKRQIHSVNLSLRIATNVVKRFCGERMAPENIPTIKSATSLDTYNNIIQKAEASLIPCSQELWFHHGPSTFATTPNMIIDVGHKLEQLSLKVVGDWFSVETTDSEICLFYAPVRSLNELIENGHLGYAGIHGIQNEINFPGTLRWLEPIKEHIDGGLTNEKMNGICASYTNEAIQLRLNSVFDSGEHPQIFE